VLDFQQSTKLERTTIMTTNNNDCIKINHYESFPITPETPPRLPFNLYYELKELFNIAIPTVAVQFCTFIIFPITASYVGRNLNDNDMAAFSLASLSGNLTCISIIIGTLSATETLQPRAFSLGEYEKVGTLAIQGLIMCIISLLLPILILMTCMKMIFSLLGQDPIVTNLCVQWIHVFIWSVPFILLFRVMQRFLACQNIVLPCLVGSSISSLLIHPLLLHWLITYFGFRGSAFSIVITQCIQLILTFLYLSQTKSYVKDTWQGINLELMKKVFEKRDLIKISKLSLGGIFALSEWWYWESICFVAGRLGVLSLCVHSVTYQLIPLIYMIPLGFSIGLSVRMGQLLPVDVNKAKLLAIYTMGLVSILALAVTSILYYNQLWIVSLFTTDQDVINGCSEIWPHVCTYILGLYIFCLNSGILRALGLQIRMGITIILVLWCFSLPCILYVCVFGEFIDADASNETGVGGLVNMWRIILWSYNLLNVGLIICYATVDWHEIGRNAAYSTKELTVHIQDNFVSYDKEGNIPTDKSPLLSGDSKSVVGVDYRKK
jgi:MATE family multidrug resistance protein